MAARAPTGTESLGSVFQLGRWVAPQGATLIGGRGSENGRDGGLYAFMRRVLTTESGGELYAKRQGMIEPIFPQTKFNHRCDCFHRRGRAACRSEWRLIAATHNLLKLWRHHSPPLPA